MVSKMAKDGVLKSADPSTACFRTAIELKKELQRLVKAIIDDDNDVAEDEAMRVLNSLKDLKFEKPSSLKLVDSSNLAIPEEFKCPISRELMRDPVILATGLTYDRSFIERWLKEGHRTCPQTQLVLSHTVLTPNHLVQDMISQWFSDRGLSNRHRTISHESPSSGRGNLEALLDKVLSPSLTDRKEAARELRSLTRTNPSSRELFGESEDSVARLVGTLVPGRVHEHPDLQEDLITTLLNLSIHENNKRLVVGDSSAVSLLVESLGSGTARTRSNAAAALFTLSDTQASKLVIGSVPGAVRSLIDLLNDGDDDPQAMKDAASAMFSLCMALENKRRAVREGAVPVIIGKIRDSVMVPELLSILALLSVHQRAVEEMDDLSAVSLLLGILRDSDCETSKENCIAILYTMCYNDRVKLREIKAEEVRNGTLTRLSRTGTSRAKRKANSILERINRAALITHTT